MKFRTVESSEVDLGGQPMRLVTVKSPSLNRRADCTLFHPVQGEHLPVIVLLHGVYGSHWSWAAQGQAHLTLHRMMQQGEIGPFVLAMPSDGLYGDGSGYVPHADANYEAWIGQDIPALVQQLVPGVDAASRFYIGGLSMGGYGALRVGLLYDRYSGISGHSAITALSQMPDFVEEDWSGLQSTVPHPAIVDVLAQTETPPQIRFDCGTEDPLLQANRDLHHNMQHQEVGHEYHEFAGGHTWDYWTRHVAETFRFFHGIEQEMK